MNLFDILSTIWRSKWIIIATAIVAAGFVFYRSYSQETIYQAEAILAVGNFGGARLSGEDKIAASYAELAQTRNVLEKSIELGQLDKKPWQLVGKVNTVTAKDSIYIKLRATDANNAETAVNIVNSVAMGLRSYVEEIQKNDAIKNLQTVTDELAIIEKDLSEARANPARDLSRINALEDARNSLLIKFEDKSLGSEAGKLTLIQAAEFATASAPSTIRNTIIGFIMGVVGGVLVGFAVDSIRKQLASGKSTSSV